jgi:hypothetical protein
MKETDIQSYLNPNVRAVGQGEARHWKYKRLKLGDSQAYDQSGVCCLGVDK